MTYNVNVGNKTDFTLIENDLHRSVLQNLAVLFATKKGTIPMYREFGLEMKFIDMPMEAAKTVLLADVIENAKRFEPRAQIVDVKYVADEEIKGTAKPVVEVRIIE